MEGIVKVLDSRTAIGPSAVSNTTSYPSSVRTLSSQSKKSEQINHGHLRLEQSHTRDFRYKSLQSQLTPLSTLFSEFYWGISKNNIPVKILSQTAKKSMTRLLRRFGTAKKMKSSYFISHPVDIRIICPNLQT